MSTNGWQITTIEVAGASATDAVAMAPDGEIIGIATISGTSDGFVFNSGTATLLDVPGALSTTPAAINASGVIVGSFTTTTVEQAVTSTIDQGFIDNAGTFTTLDYPGALNSFAVGVNDSGEVVGWYNGVSNGTSLTSGSFLLSGGQYSSINVTGGTNVTAEGINDAGQIVGFYAAGSSAEGFVDTAGTVSTISVPGSTATVASAINATGTIVGYYTDAEGNGHGFLDAGGTITTFDPPGAVSTLPLGISDGGTIYGAFRTGSGTTDGFIGTPGTFTEFDLPGALTTSIAGVGSAGDMAGNVEYPGAPGSTTPGPSQALFIVPTTPVHWVAGSGDFNTATNWNPHIVPGATNDAIIDAGGTYTVTAGTSETVNTLSMVAAATLVVSGGTFTVGNGSGTGALAGSISVGAGAVLALAGPVYNTGTLTIAGQLAGGPFSLTNGGVVNADGTSVVTIDLVGVGPWDATPSSLIETTGAGGLTIAGNQMNNAGTVDGAGAGGLTVGVDGVVNLTLSEATGTGELTITGGGVANVGTVDGAGSGGLTLDPGSGQEVVNTDLGLIEATGAGGLTIASGTISNAGTMLAAGGGTLAFAAGVVNQNNSGGVLLRGGTWEASGGTLAVTGGAVEHDNATIILAGAGSSFSAGDGSSFTNLEASLLGISPYGTLGLDAGAAFAAANAIADFGMIQLAGGTLTAPRLALGAIGQVSGFGTIAAPISNAGTIETTGPGGLAIASGTVSNNGTLLAANGGTLAFAPGVVNQNNTGGVLSGGTWEASGSGSTLAVTGKAVAHDAATVILAGAGAVFSAGDGGSFTNLEASLAGVNPVGTLALDAGASFTAANGIGDFGMIQLAGGTLTAPRLALPAAGQVRGSGTIADTRYAISNDGTIEANGGTLAIATAIDPASSGTFELNASSVLEIAADQGTADTMSFLGPSELIIDDVGKFGLNVGTSAYTGPLVENFASGDTILLKNLLPAGLAPLYNPATGILQITNGATSFASLAFDNATLGAGTFELAGDGLGDTVLTRS